MRIHRKRIYWFCLLTYLWSATGLISIATVSAITNDHTSGQVVVIAGQDDEVIVHHVGHRDIHDPTANDANDANDTTGQMARDADHGHSDHVLKLDSESDGNGSFPTAHKFTNLLAGKLLCVAPHVMISATVVALDFLPAHITVRNSSIAIVQMTRLRI